MFNIFIQFTKAEKVLKLSTLTQKNKNINNSKIIIRPYAYKIYSFLPDKLFIYY